MRRSFAAFAAAVLTALMLGPACSGAQDGIVLPPAGTASPRLAALEQAYVQRLFADQPSTATQAGIHVYDDRLPDLSAAATAARIASAHAQLAGLDTLTRSGEKLNDEDAADVQIMRSALERQLIDDEMEQRWKLNPGSYTSAA